MYGTTPAADQLVDRLASYGVQASGEVVTQEYHEQVDYADQMTLSQLVNDNGGRITRVRLLTERWPSGRMADVSYIHGTTRDGRIVPVYVGVVTGALYGPEGVKARFIQWAREEGVYAKGCGLLDESTWSVLY